MDLSQLCVLVVEDEALMRRFIVSSLNRLGIENVLEATDGKAGLFEAINRKPDIVLTDIHMATMNGIEFVSNLRGRADTADIRVIFMTADNSVKTLSEAIPLGASAYIVKPPRLPDLQAKLQQALNKT